MCGIWGYNSSNQNKFNKYKFNSLGQYNDKRGGDSCGVVIINNEEISVNYGNDKEKLYTSLIESGVQIPSQAHIALGHARKASVGGIGERQAQPVILLDEDNNIDFVMIHNGTLLNYKEIANKYNVKFDDSDTDSQVFGKVIYSVGFKVFGEYTGAGAFVIWSKKLDPDAFFVFKGASLYYSDEDTLYIERPLFFLKEKSSLWFSSMDESLKFINDNESKIIDVPYNKLIKVKDGNYKEIGEFNRSSFYQTANPTKKNYTRYSGNYGNNYAYGNSYNYGNNYYGSYNRSNSEQSKLLYQKDVSSFIVDTYLPKDKVYFSKYGLYMINDELCHGEIECSNAGFINASSVADKKKYWFFRGVYVNNEESFLAAKLIFDEEYNSDAKKFNYISIGHLTKSAVPVIIVNERTNEFINPVMYTYNDVSKSSFPLTTTMEIKFCYTKNVYKMEKGSPVKLSVYSNRVEN